MSEKQNIFESLKEDTKELDKMKNTIERLKEDLNILNGSSNDRRINYGFF